MKFVTKLEQAIEQKKSKVCVGLDSRYDKLPEWSMKSNSVTQSIFDFNKVIVDETHHVAASYKSNVAFYGGFGAEALEALKETNAYIKATYPEIPLLADCKRSEMGESVNMVKQEIFDWLGFDCVMATPWFGKDTIVDYLPDESKGVCIYVHDSNPSAPDIQGLRLANGQYLYEYVASLIASDWNSNGNVFIEVGSTYPEALMRSRKIVGEDMVILTAGVGIQGGKLQDLTGVLGKDKNRFIVNSSRGIIFPTQENVTKEVYAQKVRQAAEGLRDALQAL